ncbi:DUF2793 domain-containing protein [Sphingomonadaceae bacterium jetA1]|uniref:DUF2793 domain-containing protein n=1 Tax=Facivitalis istanbulensis TaxID=3075838 RepID=UPI0034754E93
MVDSTARWALPFLVAGQAQKEITHNEALAALDLIVQPCVEAVGRNAPPADPMPGQGWIVGAQPVDDWAGQADRLAGWTEGGWRFVAPRLGLAVWSKADSCRAEWDGDAWRIGLVVGRGFRIGEKTVIGAQQSAIADPVGGQVVDSEVRTVVSTLLEALRTHGLIAAG